MKQPFFEGNPRLIAEDLSSQGNISETIPNVAHSIPPGYLRLDALFAEGPRHLLRDFADGVRSSASYIQDMPGSARHFQGQPAGLHTVQHGNEVALLITVLIDERRAIVQKSRGEDSKNASVGIGKGLARTKDVEKP